MKLVELEARLAKLLQPELHADCCPNGLQVGREGREVNRLALAVSATLEVIQQAIAWWADALLTHHGLFWQGASPCLTGPLQSRVKALLGADLALLSYHLPLDRHPLLGNNAQLGLQLGLGQGQAWGPANAGLRFQLQLTPQELVKRISDLLGQAPRHLDFGPTEIRQMVIVTGGGQNYVATAFAEGADCFVTGLLDEPNYAAAQEAKAHLFGLGHHASEQFGVRALGQWLGNDLECKFIQTRNPL